jgi:hypothetical protein
MVAQQERKGKAIDEGVPVSLLCGENTGFFVSRCDDTPWGNGDYIEGGGASSLAFAASLPHQNTKQEEPTDMGL